jgi:hypothetical protein
MEITLNIWSLVCVYFFINTLLLICANIVDWRMSKLDKLGFFFFGILVFIWFMIMFVKEEFDD